VKRRDFGFSIPGTRGSPAPRDPDDVPEVPPPPSDSEQQREKQQQQPERSHSHKKKDKKKHKSKRSHDRDRDKERERRAAGVVAKEERNASSNSTYSETKEGEEGTDDGDDGTDAGTRFDVQVEPVPPPVVDEASSKQGEGSKRAHNPENDVVSLAENPQPDKSEPVVENKDEPVGLSINEMLNSSIDLDIDFEKKQEDQIGDSDDDDDEGRLEVDEPDEEMPEETDVKDPQTDGKSPSVPQPKSPEQQPSEKNEEEEDSEGEEWEDVNVSAKEPEKPAMVVVAQKGVKQVTASDLKKISSLKLKSSQLVTKNSSASSNAVKSPTNVLKRLKDSGAVFTKRAAAPPPAVSDVVKIVPARKKESTHSGSSPPPNVTVPAGLTITALGKKIAGSAGGLTIKPAVKESCKVVRIAPKPVTRHILPRPQQATEEADENKNGQGEGISVRMLMSKVRVWCIKFEKGKRTLFAR
jgi:hypothetical protein